MPVPALKAIRESIQYGFAVGKVRVLETRVFGLATYERLFDSADFEEQRRILSDTIYGRYLDGARSTSDVERGLDSALDDFYRFLEEAHLPEPVVRFFRERYDFANLKGALKARLLSTPVDDLLVDLGTIPIDEFDGQLEELPEPFGSLSQRVLEAARTSAEDAAKEATPDSGTSAADAFPIVDAEVDRAMFVRLGRLANESGSAFLKQLAELQVDIANVKSLLRARLADVPTDDALATALKGGSIPVRELAKLYGLPLAEAVARLAELPALSGIPASELSDVARLDVIADNVVVGYLRRARAVSIGAEPVIAYVMGREAEVRAVRTLLIGRLAGLPTGVLRSRLRNLYV